MHKPAFDALPQFVVSLVDLVSRTGPATLADAGLEINPVDFAGALSRSWNNPYGEDLEESFFARAILQPYAATLPPGMNCPWCSGPPQTGSLRSQGDGLAFDLTCGLCLRQRAFPRTRCPSCDEASEGKLVNFTSDDFPSLRLQACESCRGYLVVIDLSRDPAAIPEVDEISALPLDVWAVEQGYHKVVRNIVGF
jgi:FdhE protein